MNFPGEALLIKMWSTLFDSGIAGLMRPFQEKRVGHAQTQVLRERIIEIGKAHKAVRKILSNDVESDQSQIANEAEIVNHVVRLPPTLDPTDLWEFARVGCLSDALRKEANVACAALEAAKIIEESPDASFSEESVDEDWLFRWRDAASTSSKETLQVLWGKVLAGECRQPGSFSLRTIDFLKCLSLKEAELIALASRAYLGEFIPSQDKKALEKLGLDRLKLMTLQELGVLQGAESEAIALALKVDSTGRGLLVGRRYGVAFKEGKVKAEKVAIRAYRLTKLGSELVSLSGDESDVEFLAAFAQRINSGGLTARVVEVLEAREEPGGAKRARIRDIE